MSEALDAWQKFSDLRDAVLTWSEDKNAFLANVGSSADLATLAAARQRLADAAAAAKSAKYAGKNVQEMQREMSRVSSTSSASRLAEQMQETEQRKAETESGILEKVGERHFS